MDADGNIYITGNFEDTATFGSITLISQGYCDVFIAKIDTNGIWQWAQKAGGTGDDRGYGIAVDSNGNAYITGFFSDTSYFGTTLLTSQGISDVFVAKINTNGVWQWAKSAGGTNNDYGWNIAVDVAGNPLITGDFIGTVVFGSTTLISQGEDVFVAKLNTDGIWQWAKNGGGIYSDTGWGIISDENGNIYISGDFSGTATFGTTLLTTQGYSDVLVAKLDTNGVWQWAQRGGGSGYDYGIGIDVDNNGNAYITGIFQDTGTFGATTLNSQGNYDVFVSKISTNGVWQWAEGAGGISYDYGRSIVLDGNKNSYITGDFNETATFGDITLTSQGSTDVFVAKLSFDGDWLWAKSAGGTNTDGGQGVSVDADWNIYITGEFWYIVTFGTTTLTSQGEGDVFVAKLSDIGGYEPWYFVHITDPHVVCNVFGDDELWHAVIDDIANRNPPPDFVLCTGDLVDYGKGVLGNLNYDELIGALFKQNNDYYIDSDCTIPIYFCPGNHDARLIYQVLGPYGFEGYHSYIGPDYYIHTHKNCKIFSLNSGCDIWPGFWGDLLVPEGDGLAAKYDNEVIKFTNDASNSNEALKIVLIHHPFIAQGNDGKDGSFWNGRNQFNDTCSNCSIDFVFSGHLHNMGGVKPICTKTEQIITDSIVDEPSYRIIHVDANGVYNYESQRLFYFNLLEGYLNGYIACQTDVHIYDEQSNHNGPNEIGEIEREIPMSRYSYWKYNNDTYNLNDTTTNFMLPKNESKNYTIIIESASNDSNNIMNVSLGTSLIDGNWIVTYYLNVPLYNGSIATIYANYSEYNNSIVIEDSDGSIRVITPTEYTENIPPISNTPVGPDLAYAGVEYNFSFNATDENNDVVYYLIDWGDGSNTSWFGSFESGESTVMSYKFNNAGNYIIKLKAKDDKSLEGNWSDSLIINIEEPPIDANQSTFNRGFPIRHTLDGDWGGAQNFTPTTDTITKIDVYIRKMGTPDYNLTVELRKDGPSDLFGGTLLDTVVMPAVDVPSTWTWFTIDFEDTAVGAGSDVFIVLPQAPPGQTNSFGYEWGYALGNQYDGGSFWFTRNGGVLWRSLPTMYEFCFRTYGY